jgi:prophage DNA circulation protein
MPVNSNWYAPKLNGVPFICLEASIPELGRKTAIFDYPNTDSRYVEDMGKVKGVYEITAQIQANNLTPSSYKRNKKKFEKALSKEGLGVLIHPTLGRKKVVVVNPKQTEAMQGQIGLVNYKFLAVEADENKYPKKLDDKKGLLNKLDEFLKQKLGAGLEDMINGIDDALESYNAVRDGITAVSDFMQQGMETINGINDEIAGLTADINNIKNTINDVVNFPSKFATAFVANLNRLIQVTSNFSDAFSLQKNVFNKTPIAKPSFLAETKIANVIQNTTKIALMSNSFQIATAINFNNQSNINNIIKELEQMYQSIDPNLIDDEIFTIIETIRAESLISLKNIKLKLPYVNIINTNSLPAIALAYNYYNNASGTQYENIISLNKIQDPSSIGGNIKVFVS